MGFALVPILKPLSPGAERVLELAHKRGPFGVHPDFEVSPPAGDTSRIVHPSTIDPADYHDRLDAQDEARAEARR